MCNSENVFVLICSHTLKADLTLRFLTLRSVRALKNMDNLQRRYYVHVNENSFLLNFFKNVYI